ncbi:hypothetical protein [Paenibacillus sp. GXUN7292]|uniref:hypothetical protein n=1 Tax=Paenibacillus sp. GXUN7292 TaxID=3422499 RepID=UPI003D7E547E
MAHIYNFSMYRKMKNWSRNADMNRELFQKYVLASEQWANDGYYKTLYEGYPFEPPCEPAHPEMEWYVSKSGNFGVWLLNYCKGEQIVSKEIGWSPFVRKSVVPPFDPLNVPDRETRDSLTWIVDEQGFGQYGSVMSDGSVWVPCPNPNVELPKPVKIFTGR